MVLNLNFATPSGKIEFYSTQLADAGFDPVPKYTKHPEPPSGLFQTSLWKSTCSHFQ